MINTISDYIRALESKTTHRFLSWDICYEKFQSTTNDDLLSLHLAFFLASWGMYRGSSQLLQNNYLIHREAVQIILSNPHPKDLLPPTSEAYCSQLKPLIQRLKTHYRQHSISPTDTLISKIILGTTALSPALDRYFIEGVKSKGEKFTCLSDESLMALHNYTIAHNQEISACKELVLKRINKNYPSMKIIDIYFWTLGYKKLNPKKSL